MDQKEIRITALPRSVRAKVTIVPQMMRSPNWKWLRLYVIKGKVPVKVSGFTRQNGYLLLQFYPIGAPGVKGLLKSNFFTKLPPSLKALS